MHNPVLRYVDEVARQHSIRKAARVLNIASTAVNRQILKLEGELGMKIFERVPEGVTLTPAGEVLVAHIRKTLFDFQRTRAELADIKGLRVGHIRLSTLDSLTFEFLPRILDGYAREHPGVTFTILTANPDEISEAVASGAADIGLGFTHYLHPGLRIRSETPTPFGAVVAPNHPLASRRYVTLEECAQYPITRTHDPAGKALFLEEEARLKGVVPTMPFYSNSLVMTKYAIRAGLGIGIFTKAGFTREIAEGELRFVPLVETALSEYKLGIFISATRNLSLPAHLLVKVIEKELRASDFSN
ncbi:LysR family transcriptional regulator [Nitratireductor sp. ZSWI3]|uniref:LysR family transcriptional regulator n=1 Tax=Nitratireductor sp. ZSWI3 TaxID=2966359 RepID=UPI00215010EF|nr:LysR family transcriptional regulator [Nitratireductor sp. ZSWI3]MCR4268131.1 LysR family transcriptional regulator [Nitratireductor sp. ZSWI3]